MALPDALSYLGEESLDLVLECEVECLGGEVPDDIGGVPSPEGRESLLLVYAREAAIFFFRCSRQNAIGNGRQQRGGEGTEEVRKGMVSGFCTRSSGTDTQEQQPRGKEGTERQERRVARRFALSPALCAPMTSASVHTKTTKFHFLGCARVLRTRTRRFSCTLEFLAARRVRLRASARGVHGSTSVCRQRDGGVLRSYSLDDAGVASHLAGLDTRVGVLSLHNELDALDRGRACLGDGTADSAEGEVDQEVRLLLSRCHLCEKGLVG